MNILDQLSTLHQVPGVVNNIISNYGSLIRPLLTDRTKNKVLLRTNLPPFLTFIVDNQTDNMYGLVQHSSKVHIFNPLGEFIGIYELSSYDMAQQLCIKGDTLYALHQKKKANYVSVHKQMKNDCKFQYRGAFNCEGHQVEDICIDAGGTHLVALWFGGLSIYDVKNGLIVKEIRLLLRSTIIVNLMTISATNVVYVSNYSGSKIIRVPLFNETSPTKPDQHQTMGSTLLCGPSNIVISPHNEIFVFHTHAWDELVIFSNTGKVLNSIRMTLSQLQFRSNGSLVTFNSTDGINVFS